MLQTATDSNHGKRASKTGWQLLAVGHKRPAGAPYGSERSSSIQPLPTAAILQGPGCACGGTSVGTAASGRCRRSSHANKAGALGLLWFLPRGQADVVAVGEHICGKRSSGGSTGGVQGWQAARAGCRGGKQHGRGAGAAATSNQPALGKHGWRFPSKQCQRCKHGEPQVLRHEAGHIFARHILYYAGHSLKSSPLSTALLSPSAERGRVMGRWGRAEPPQRAACKQQRAAQLWGGGLGPTHQWPAAYRASLHRQTSKAPCIKHHMLLCKCSLQTISASTHKGRSRGSLAPPPRAHGPRCRRRSC